MGMIRRSSATSLAGWFILLAVLLSAVSVTAYAVTRSGAPKPPPRSLASAAHIALTPHHVTGVSAQFAIDQHLLAGSSSTISASPISGATGRVWVAGGRVRLDIHSQLGTTEVAFDGHQVTLWDKKHHVAYILPVAHHASATADAAKKTHTVPSIAAINRGIARLGKVAVVSGAIPSNVAGQKAYTVRLAPRHNGGLFGNFELAWDAARGVRCTSRSIPTARARPRSPSRSPTSTTARCRRRVSLSPRRRARRSCTCTCRRNDQQGREDRPRLAVGHRRGGRLQGRRLPARRSGHAGRVLAGRGALGGRRQEPGSARDLRQGPWHRVRARAARHRGTSQTASLPAATVNGAKGHELDTTLGSLVQFTRGGITYTVVGSQPAATIMTAAQSLR